MGILLWIVFGLIAGILAKWIMPGRDPGGWIVTILLGIAGAFVGGMIGTVLGFGGVSGFDIRSLLVAIGGALLLLFGYRLVTNRVAA
ncbi:MAG: GlsB/YeaQ/YmgE family stress response membrane protein [Planctomycetaceae bacterium]|nr:GlsB/YeaQ/YmgE family stress response membrane protein [Planctomycetales bacterium]MCB9922404.1 GlsB/YeaQ/YmgE family stress response membrane protein [Planctomycetaceae bacterium]